MERPTLCLARLKRTALFTIGAILSLAFGIGANTAVFSLLDQVMLRLSPVKHSACLAGFIPALRASRIDLTNALRYE